MLSLLSIVLLALPANSKELNCDARDNLGQSGLNRCSYMDFLKSAKRISKVLEPQTLNEWKKVSNQVCLQVWKDYEKGSIYPLKVNQCMSRMNNYLYYSNKGGMKGMDKKYELY